MAIHKTGFANEDKEFLLVQDKGTSDILLYNSQGDRVNITNQIPEGFIPTDINGKHFVLSRASGTSVEIIHVDPTLVNFGEDAEGAEIDRVEAARIEAAYKFWNKEVLGKRDDFIKQAKSGYEPFLDAVPFQYKGTVENRVKAQIERLYTIQEREIIDRYTKALSTQDLDLESPPLPFDRFTTRIQKVMEVLPEYIKSKEDYLQEERVEVQKDFYISLFDGIFGLCCNQSINLETIDVNLLDVLANGWDARSQEQVNAVGVVGDLISGLSEAMDAQIEIVEARKVVGFLSHHVSKDPGARVGVLTGQVSRILKKKEEVRKRFLSQIQGSFGKVEPEQLTDWDDNPSKPHRLGEARDFAFFLTNDVDSVAEKEIFYPDR